MQTRNCSKTEAYRTAWNKHSASTGEAWPSTCLSYTLGKKPAKNSKLRLFWNTQKPRCFSLLFSKLWTDYVGEGEDNQMRTCYWQQFLVTLWSTLSLTVVLFFTYMLFCIALEITPTMFLSSVTGALSELLKKTGEWYVWIAFLFEFVEIVCASVPFSPPGH